MQIHRREFLARTGALVAGSLAVTPRLHAGATRAQAALRAPEIDALFARSIVVDALSVDDTWDEAVFAAFKRSGVTAIQTSLANRNLAVATRDLGTWQARFDAHRDRLAKALKAADIVEASRAGRIAVVLGFQNATMVETDVRNLDPLHAMGARCIQLTYNSRNLLGDGCTERTNAGLSDFGVAVVERMNELGIIVDLSHCGEQTAWDAIQISKQPPAFTHTMCKAVYNHVRAKSDEQLRAIAQKGGMIGVATLGYFIGPTPATSFDDYLRHLDHAVKVAGLDHVGLASDYSIRGIEPTATRETWYVPRLSSFKPIYNVRWPPWIKELDSPERFRTIAHGLGRRGYTSEQIEKILGGNWVNYFREIFRG